MDEYLSVTDNGNTEIQNDDDRERSRRLSLQANKAPAEIEGYSIVRRLGTGAYGTVWLAREDRTGRMVAVKFYPHRRGLNWSMLSREVEKLAAVYTSRNIVRLLDVGWNAEPPYFVMEYVENGSLGNFLARGRISVEEAIRITREICSALIDAHGAGVLHCDLKPDNVLLDNQLHARLCDFGQSRMSHEQSPALGTLYYMAPEQADLEALPDARWDVYAVGALLYHMLTGDPPHRNEATQRRLEKSETLDQRLKTYQQIIHSSGVPSGHRAVRGVDRRLAEIIERCLAVAPGDRLPNAQAVRDEMDARDRQRTRRPLLMLGVVAPVLLMAAMVPIFVNALTRNLHVTEQQITDRALESDALSARLQAAGLEDELNDRLDELENIIADPRLSSSLELMFQQSSDDVVALVSAASEGMPLTAEDDARLNWMRQLDAAWERSQAANARRHYEQDTSWFLTNADGVQIWRREYSSLTLAKAFRYRDYFHGRGLDYPEDQIPEDVQPLTTRHVSVAYKSTTTDRQTVALSVPVRNSAGEVIGVFARTANLGDLQSRLGRRIQDKDDDSVKRIIALAEFRESENLRLLDHPYLTEEFVKSAERKSQDVEVLEKLTMSNETVLRIREALGTRVVAVRKVVKLPVYLDPVGQLLDANSSSYAGEWIAALAPVEGTGWLVIVQERRDAALQPVQTMADRASRQAWLAVLIAVAMMAMVWFFVWRAFGRTNSLKVHAAE